MTSSKTQIYNITLNILGVSTPLENSDFDDNRAILLNNYYELARDYVLKDFDWNFASCFKKLSLCGEGIEESCYKYCYDYPNDCICARDVFSKDDFVLKKFSINALKDGSKAILTDAEDAVLRYTKRIDKEVFYSAEYTMALSYYLASLTSNVISGSLQKGELAYEKYKQILKHAKLINASEGAENLVDDTTYIDSRC